VLVKGEKSEDCLNPKNFFEILVEFHSGPFV
jgi:hypothetical protein